MIDNLAVKAPLGPHQPRHLKHLAQVHYSWNSTQKSKPTDTFVHAPPMAAQITVRYWVEDDGIAWLWMKIPLATAAVGQNLVHGGPERLWHEVRCASLIARIVLATLGFIEQKIQHWQKNTQTEFCELTWHTAVASVRAKRNWLAQTARMLNYIRVHSILRDIGVKKVKGASEDNADSVLAILKSGDEFRQYDKHAQSLTRKVRRGREQPMMPGFLGRKVVLDAVKLHVRNEVRLHEKTLRQHGLEHPNSWPEGGLIAALHAVMIRVGLSPVGATACSRTAKDVSPQVRNTWRQWEQGEDLSVLPPYTRSRHRQLILAAGGPDVAFPCRLPSGQRSAKSIGQQISFLKRFKASAELRAYALTTESGERLERELESGLAYILHGEIPADLDEEELRTWLYRWNEYLRKEGVI